MQTRGRSFADHPEPGQGAFARQIGLHPAHMIMSGGGDWKRLPRGVDARRPARGGHCGKLVIDRVAKITMAGLRSWISTRNAG